MVSGIMAPLQSRLNARIGHGEWAGLASLWPTLGCVVVGVEGDRTASLDTLCRGTRAFARSGRS